MKTMTPPQILDLPLGDNDSGQSTIRGYLVALLSEVWNSGEDFSGKRPFGNSGWESDLHGALIEAELIAGSIGEYGEAVAADWPSARHLIQQAIGSMGESEPDAATVTKWFCRNAAGSEFEWPTEEVARGHVAEQGCALVKKTISIATVLSETVVDTGPNSTGEPL